MSEMIRLSGIDSQKHNQEERFFNDDTNDPLPERADASVCDRPMGRPRRCPDIYLYDGQRARNNSQPLVRGISGSSIVGNSTSGSFLYNGSTVTILTDPSATNYITDVTGISGNSAVGYFTEATPGFFYGFLYNISTQSYATLADPLRAGPHSVQGTQANGIDGGNIVGNYVDAMDNEHGFLYSGGTWTTLDDPGGSRRGVLQCHWH